MRGREGGREGDACAFTEADAVYTTSATFTIHRTEKLQLLNLRPTTQVEMYLVSYKFKCALVLAVSMHPSCLPACMYVDY